MALIGGLVSYWKLDGNSADSVASNNGTDTSVTYATGNGKINQGAAFSSSSNIDVADNATLRINTAISISAWIKLSTLGNYSTILQKGERYLFRTLGSNNKLDFFLSGLTGADLQGTTVLTTGVWYHVVATYDGATMSIYLNGSLDNSKSQTGSITTGTEAASIGWDSFDGGGNVHFLGDIDEVGLWSRALTSTEVSQLYNGGSGLQYPFGEPLSANTAALLLAQLL